MTPGKPPDDPRSIAQKGPDSGHEQTVNANHEGTQTGALDRPTAKAIDETLEFEQAIDHLPADQKILALLNIRNPVEVVTLPEPFRAMTITIPRKNLGAATEHLGQFGLQASSDFVGDTHDDEVNLTYILP